VTVRFLGNAPHSGYNVEAWFGALFRGLHDRRLSRHKLRRGQTPYLCPLLMGEGTGGEGDTDA
jgi:hypothetical protein